MHAWSVAMSGQLELKLISIQVEDCDDRIKITVPLTDFISHFKTI